LRYWKRGKPRPRSGVEVGEGDDTVVVEDTSKEDDDEETLQDRFQLRSRFSRPGSYPSRSGSAG
jgi:hypothetical protein